MPQRLKPVCYMDQDLLLPVSDAGKPPRFLLAPRTQAKLTQALDLDETKTVLDVACASGYSTALLCALAKSVVAVESDGTIAATAREILQRLQLTNASVMTGRLAEGAPEEGPFDAILINGSVDFAPNGLLDQLKDGGRLVTILAAPGIGRATQWLRTGSRFGQAALFDANAPKLSEFTRERGFVF